MEGGDDRVTSRRVCRSPPAQPIDPHLRDCSPVLTNDWKDVLILSVKSSESKQCENMNIVEAGKLMGKHSVDVMLDIAVADGLATEFYSAPVNTDVQGFREIVALGAGAKYQHWTSLTECTSAHSRKAST